MEDRRNLEKREWNSATIMRVGKSTIEWRNRRINRKGRYLNGEYVPLS